MNELNGMLTEQAELIIIDLPQLVIEQILLASDKGPILSSLCKLWRTIWFQCKIKWYNIHGYVYTNTWLGYYKLINNTKKLYYLYGYEYEYKNNIFTVNWWKNGTIECTYYVHKNHIYILLNKYVVKIIDRRGICTVKDRENGVWLQYNSKDLPSYFKWKYYPKWFRKPYIRMYQHEPIYAQRGGHFVYIKNIGEKWKRCYDTCNKSKPPYNSIPDWILDVDRYKIVMELLKNIDSKKYRLLLFLS